MSIWPSPRIYEPASRFPFRWRSSRTNQDAVAPANTACSRRRRCDRDAPRLMPRRYTDGARKTSDRLYPGSLPFLGVHRGVGLLRNVLACCGYGRASRFRSWSRHRRRPRASGCCDHRDRLRHVGVVNRSIGVRSSGGARGCVVEHRRFLHRFDVRGAGRRGGTRRGAGQGSTFWGRHGCVRVAPL